MYSREEEEEEEGGEGEAGQSTKGPSESQDSYIDYHSVHCGGGKADRQKGTREGGRAGEDRLGSVRNKERVQVPLFSTNQPRGGTSGLSLLCVRGLSLVLDGGGGGGGCWLFLSLSPSILLPFFLLPLPSSLPFHPCNSSTLLLVLLLLLLLIARPRPLLFPSLFLSLSLSLPVLFLYSLLLASTPRFFLLPSILTCLPSLDVISCPCKPPDQCRIYSLAASPSLPHPQRT